MLTARDIMIPNPIQVRYDLSVYEGAKIMKQYNIASLIVVDAEGRVLGMITAKDIVLRVVAKGLDPKEVKLVDILSKPVTVVDPETPLKSVVNMMIGTGHGHIPVVDKSGRAMGIVTVDDVLKILPELLEHEEIMRK
ncbi:MAG TPA: CBS domain-containing protein [Ignisphaera sp.]|nr:CBS domain-containing protein [Ignisphaera sp.]